MKLAIMQPYLFPYIGYFSLIYAVDKFVFYDDVAYIKQGWINRNRILVNGQPFMFTVKLQNASSFKLINSTEIDSNDYPFWKGKFYKTIDQAYKKAPNFVPVSGLLKNVFESNVCNIGELAKLSIKVVCNYLKINTEIVNSSEIYMNTHLSGAERVKNICSQENATHYINAKGGSELYSKVDFEKSKMMLNFLHSHENTYPQFKNEFIPGLSIIDVLMFNSPEEVNSMLANYQLS